MIYQLFSFYFLIFLSKIPGDYAKGSNFILLFPEANLML